MCCKFFCVLQRLPCYTQQLAHNSVYRLDSRFCDGACSRKEEACCLLSTACLGSNPFLQVASCVRAMYVVHGSVPRGMLSCK